MNLLGAMSRFYFILGIVSNIQWKLLLEVLRMATRDLELRRLRYFLAVAEEQNFSRAAVRVGIQQPPLSQQIRQIEEILGYIFDRNSRGAYLTQAGKVFEQYARRSLAALAEGQNAGYLASRGMSGTLTLGFAASLLSTNLTDAIRSYRGEYPAVRLVLRELTTNAQIESLRRNEIDLGLGREADNVINLVSERILNEPLYAFFSKNHPLVSRTSVSPEASSESRSCSFPDMWAANSMI